MASSESDAESYDSDKELQIAFSQGLLKPGLNYEALPKKDPKDFINDVEGLKQSLADLKNDLSWVERLDMTNAPALAPKPLQDKLGENPDQVMSGDVHDDFKREMIFYRQAQAAVLEGVPKLHAFGLKSKRPEDYFAEMAKPDSHMKKVREKLLSKQMSMERSEKARKMRELRKYGKKVQQEVLQKRQKEKKQMLDAVKKYRKGKESNMDFLDEEKKAGKGNKPQKDNKNVNQPNKKRQFKNSKFGYGGQKKRSKYNSKASASDMSDFSGKKHSTIPGKLKKMKKQAKGSKGRPGKSKRQKMKGGKKK